MPHETQKVDAHCILPTYARSPVTFVHGEGAYLWSDAGEKFLDFGSGIAVNALGHQHPVIAKALAQQAQKLMHISNLYYNEPAADLALQLVENSFADKVFFCNSGTEANEAALKFARLYGKAKSPSKTGFVALRAGFHGRTMGALSITGKDKIRTPFEPLLPSTHFAELNDLPSVAAAMNADIAAVCLEPIQGEGGIHTATPAFVRGVRELCDKFDALLILDEIQCGMGRTGKLWAHQFYDVKPDIMSLAKGLGFGLPIGATLVTADVSNVVHTGDHGTTFGGNPLVCAAAGAGFRVVSDPSFLANVELMGVSLMKVLTELRTEFPGILGDIRGKGLMLGVDIVGRKAADIVDGARDAGLILLTAGENTLRILPPLIITPAHVEEFRAIMRQVLRR